MDPQRERDEATRQLCGIRRPLARMHARRTRDRCNVAIDVCDVAGTRPLHFHPPLKEIHMNTFDLRRGARARRIAAGLRFAATMLVLSLFLHGLPAQAGAIVVGRGPDCTVPTIREAIQRANGFGGYNLILVTDEVPDGVYHENLLLQNLREDLALELVGGYADCTTLAPTAFGKASLYGGDVNRPVLRLRGHNDVTLRGFWMQSGTGEGDYGGGGIDFQGYGSLVLENVRVAESNDLGYYGAGIHVSGELGTALLSIASRVEVTDQHDFASSGISMHGTSVLLMRGDGHSIRGNTGSGIKIMAPAVADIGTTGTILSGNGFGIIVNSPVGRSSGALARLYSTDAANPLRIADNGGALFAMGDDGTSIPNRICTRNVLIQNNGDIAVLAGGRHASIDINPDANDICEFPPAAAITCPSDLPCIRIAYNGASTSQPLVLARGDASISLNRVLFDHNRATSLLSTNLGTAASVANITMTQSLVLYNTLRDNLFEALNGGIVDIWDSTVAGNGGGFGVSLVGSDPTLFQVTNSIIDQPQGLVYLSNGPVETTHFRRVLAHNRSGAAAGDDILIGQPDYLDAFGRLKPDSPGVDYAPAAGGTDFDGKPRDVDTANLPNWLGPRDLGAFESQAATLDVLFADGFEPSPARPH
jgi:hypothetical protein